MALVTAAVTAGAGLLLRRLFRGGRHNEPPAPPGPPPPEYVQEYRRATRMVNTHLRLGAYLLLLAAIVIASFKHVWEIAVLELLLGLMLLTEEVRRSKRSPAGLGLLLVALPRSMCT